MVLEEVMRVVFGQFVGIAEEPLILILIRPTLAVQGRCGSGDPVCERKLLSECI